jgi:hypothetical protein
MIRLLVPLLLLGACAPDPPKPAATKAADPAAAKAADPAAAKAADPDALPVYRVAVAPGGLMLTDRRGGAAKPADFGLRQSILIAILARSFGPAGEGREAGCALDFARWPNGLTLWFEGGSFVGWTRADAATAAIGIAPGLAPAAARAAGETCESAT